MSSSSKCCLSVKELGRYLCISYDKAVDLANDPSFPREILLGKVIPKAKIAVWLEARMNSPQLKNQATDKATRALTHKKA